MTKTFSSQSEWFYSKVIVSCSLWLTLEQKSMGISLQRLSKEMNLNKTFWVEIIIVSLNFKVRTPISVLIDFSLHLLWHLVKFGVRKGLGRVRKFWQLPRTILHLFNNYSTIKILKYIKISSADHRLDPSFLIIVILITRLVASW